MEPGNPYTIWCPDERTFNPYQDTYDQDGQRQRPNPQDNYAPTQQPYVAQPAPWAQPGAARQVLNPANPQFSERQGHPRQDGRFHPYAHPRPRSSAHPQGHQADNQQEGLGYEPSIHPMAGLGTSTHVQTAGALNLINSGVTGEDEPRQANEVGRQRVDRCATCDMPIGSPSEYSCVCGGNFLVEGYETDSDSDMSQAEADEEVHFSGTSLGGIGGFKKAFKNVKKAREFMAEIRHYVNVKDDDVEEVKRNQMYWIRRIHEAMRTLPNNASSGEARTFRVIEDKKIEQKFFEACAYDLVGRAIDIHKKGSELVADFQIKGKNIAQMKASQRLETLIDALYNNKNIVKDALHGWKASLIVAQPGSRFKCAKASVRNNTRKKARMEELKAENARLKNALNTSANSSNAASPVTGTETSSSPVNEGDESEARGGEESIEEDEEFDEADASEADKGESALAVQGSVAGAANGKNVAGESDDDGSDGDGTFPAGRKRKRAAPRKKGQSALLQE